LSEEQLGAAVATWRERMRAHAGASYVQLIVNEGGGAGASLEHSHAQLYALGFVPAAIARERERHISYNQHTMGGELLAQIASGELIAALAWQERVGDLGKPTPATTASLESGQVVLNGAKRFVAGAAGADGFIVSAAIGAGTVLAWLPADTAGASLELQPLADGRFSGRLMLDAVKLPQAHLLAPAEIAQAALERAVDEATVMASYELLGVMERALAMTLDYLRTRSQFGRTIGSFQALQHRAVDLYVQEQLASVAAADAVAAIDAPVLVRSRVAAVSRATARCSDAAALITRQAIQMHGAIGFTEDGDVGLYVKRALTLAAWLGNSAYHRRRFAALAPADVD
jgi:alkylation response protein AidB-like acyl-CoA dehydrogenase